MAYRRGSSVDNSSSQPGRRHAVDRLSSCSSDFVQIVRFNDQTKEREFMMGNIELTLAKCADIPVMVVSVAGKYRSGKSFLANLMLSYLKYLHKKGEGRGWESSNITVEGPSWTNSSHPVTKGIWLTSKPVMLTRNDRQKVAVLIMDCQGCSDSESETALNDLIMSVSLQMSTTQLINLIDSDFSSVKKFTECLASVEDGQAKSKSYMFVLRDWDDDDYGETSDMLQAFEKYTGKHIDSDNVQDILNDTRISFEQVFTFLLPHPGGYTARASAPDNFSLTEIDKHFLRAVKELFQLIFSHDEKCKLTMTGSQMMKNYKRLQKQVCSSSVYSSPSQATVSKAQVAYQLSTKDLARKYEEEKERHLRKCSTGAPISELSKYLDQLRITTIDSYDRQCRYYNVVHTEEYRSYYERLAEDLDSLKCHIMNEVRKRLGVSANKKTSRHTQGGSVRHRRSRLVASECDEEEWGSSFNDDSLPFVEIHAPEEHRALLNPRSLESNTHRRSEKSQVELELWKLRMERALNDAVEANEKAEQERKKAEEMEKMQHMVKEQERLLSETKKVNKMAEQRRRDDEARQMHSALVNEIREAKEIAKRNAGNEIKKQVEKSEPRRWESTAAGIAATAAAGTAMIAVGAAAAPVGLVCAATLTGISAFKELIQ